jgi:hypothetical protein
VVQKFLKKFGQGFAPEPPPEHTKALLEGADMTAFGVRI